MPRKKSYPTATDQFCGAGGSSQGARRAGVEVKLAMNHWKLAVRTHAANFPDTDHDCCDISASDPRRYESTDILITSPECTNHSLAKNKKRIKKQLNIFETQQESEERSRATMWDVPRFTEYHNYNIIITENVVDAKRWVLYDAWLIAMHKLGYNHHECFLNSMHFPPTPQSRDRMYVVFYKKGNKKPDLNPHPSAWCNQCNKSVNAFQSWKPGCLSWGKYRTQYVYKCSCGNTVEPYYYAAMNCIDWTIKSERIGDKKKKLSPNTLRRVAIGVDKYWNNPFIIYGGDNGPRKTDRTYSLDKAIPTQCAQPWHQLITPFLAYTSNNHKSNLRTSDGKQPLATQTTTQDAGIIMPPFPFIIDYYTNSENKSLSEAHPAQTARLKHAVIMPPFISNSAYGGSVQPLNTVFNTQTAQQNYDLVHLPFQVELNASGTARTLAEPLNTQLASAKHNAIITNEAWQSFIGYYYGNSQHSHLTDPIGTCTTKDRHFLSYFKAGEKISVEDCYYRMIRAKEVGRAMAFDENYIVFGDERAQVRQYGNAVTPPVMEWLIKQCVKSLQ